MIQLWCDNRMGTKSKIMLLVFVLKLFFSFLFSSVSLSVVSLREFDDPTSSVLIQLLWCVYVFPLSKRGEWLNTRHARKLWFSNTQVDSVFFSLCTVVRKDESCMFPIQYSCLLDLPLKITVIRRFCHLFPVCQDTCHRSFAFRINNLVYGKTCSFSGPFLHIEGWLLDYCLCHSSSMIYKMVILSPTLWACCVTQVNLYV